MFRVVCWKDTTRYVRRSLRPEGNFVQMPYEQRKHILFFEPSLENENEAATLLVNLVDRGFVLKFVYWNSTIRGQSQTEQEQEEQNERDIAASSTDSPGMADNNTL